MRGGGGSRLLPECQSRLSLRRVVGTTCRSPTGFDSVASSFAYIAGGAVVVVDVVDVDPTAASPSPRPTFELENGSHNGPSAKAGVDQARGGGEADKVKRMEEIAETDEIEEADKIEETDDELEWDKLQAPRETEQDTLRTSKKKAQNQIGRQGGNVDRTGYAHDSLPGRQSYTQRFFRARPTAVPVYAVSLAQGTPPGITSSAAPLTPKANDSRNRSTPPGPALRDLSFNYSSQPGSPTRTWTSRERVKAATCLSLSRDGRFLAVGETGYAPRVLIFGLQNASSSDVPLVSITEHTFGVKAVAWSPDTRFLVSLGAANDGFIYVWSVDPRTGSVKLFRQNRCTCNVRGMAWMGNLLITLGVRHIKAWRVDDTRQSSPTRAKFVDPSAQRPLSGRNVLLGPLLEATFTCAAVVGDDKAIVCTESGDVCLLDNSSSSRQMKLSHVLSLDFPVSSITVQEGTAFVGGKSGQFATLEVQRILGTNPDAGILSKTEACTGVVALAFLAKNLVTIDCSHSIDIWDPAYRPGQPRTGVAHIPIPGHGEPILGVQPLHGSNLLGGAAFMTWAGSGKVTAWGLDGRIKSQLDMPVEQSASISEMGLVNQLTFVRATRDGRLLVAADKLGVLRVVDSASGECLLDTKAHSADCQFISVCEAESRFLVASCGRDRTVQLFHRRSNGAYEHFQTLEFTSKVVQVLFPNQDRLLTCSTDRTVQVYDLASKEGDPDTLAAIPSRIITLKASPTSMAVGLGGRTVFVSLLDRTVVQYDLVTGKQISAFKCSSSDGSSGAEAVTLESLTTLSLRDRDLLIGLSNTDKSVRIYDAQTGVFLDREWGHAEAIHGVALVDDDDAADGFPKAVSVGSDGTIMIWAIDSADGSCLPAQATASRDSSPSREVIVVPNSARQPLRRVLSKQELAEFQKSSPSSTAGGGHRSPPRALKHKISRTSLAAAAKLSSSATPSPGGNPGEAQIRNGGPAAAAAAANGTPPDSPKAYGRRPSFATLSITPAATPVIRKKISSSNLSAKAGNAPSSMHISSDHACRTLRALRKRISTSSEPFSTEALGELEQELRLTATAIGDRHRRDGGRQALSETALAGLLDMYSERMLAMLDEKLSLGIQGGAKAALDDTDKDSTDLEPDSPMGGRRHCACVADDAARVRLPSPSGST